MPDCEHGTVQPEFKPEKESTMKIFMLWCFICAPAFMLFALVVLGLLIVVVGDHFRGHVRDHVSDVMHLMLWYLVCLCFLIVCWGYQARSQWLDGLPAVKERCSAYLRDSDWSLWPSGSNELAVAKIADARRAAFRGQESPHVCREPLLDGSPDAEDAEAYEAKLYSNLSAAKKVEFNVHKKTLRLKLLAKVAAEFVRNLLPTFSSSVFLFLWYLKNPAEKFPIVISGVAFVGTAAKLLLVDIFMPFALK
jgi:hypothetical protein